MIEGIINKIKDEGQKCFSLFKNGKWIWYIGCVYRVTMGTCLWSDMKLGTVWDEAEEFVRVLWLNDSI